MNYKYFDPYNLVQIIILTYIITYLDSNVSMTFTLIISAIVIIYTFKQRWSHFPFMLLLGLVDLLTTAIGVNFDFNQFELYEKNLLIVINPDLAFIDVVNLGLLKLLFHIQCENAYSAIRLQPINDDVKFDLTKNFFVYSFRQSKRLVSNFTVLKEKDEAKARLKATFTKYDYYILNLVFLLISVNNVFFIIKSENGSKIVIAIIIIVCLLSNIIKYNFMRYFTKDQKKVGA